ncbi:MAG: DUF934 domain-containing protein [Caulobacteraceae bacterium]
MPMLIKWQQGQAVDAEDPFTNVGDEQHVPRGEVIVSLARFQADGDRLLGEGRMIGVQLEPGDKVEDLVFDLPRLSVVALNFPVHRDGRAYSNARLLRERYGYKGEIRAVGDVLREQARMMVRCGFDAFVAADGSKAADWAHKVRGYRHVYQRGVDGRAPAFVEREGA